MFETFGVTGLFTSEQPVLSLYGCGRVSGLCVDLGAEKTGAQRALPPAYPPPPPSAALPLPSPRLAPSLSTQLRRSAPRRSLIHLRAASQPTLPPTRPQQTSAPCTTGQWCTRASAARSTAARTSTASSSGASQRGAPLASLPPSPRRLAGAPWPSCEPTQLNPRASPAAACAPQGRGGVAEGREGDQGALRPDAPWGAPGPVGGAARDARAPRRCAG